MVPMRNVTFLARSPSKNKVLDWPFALQGDTQQQVHMFQCVSPACPASSRNMDCVTSGACQCTPRNCAIHSYSQPNSAEETFSATEIKFHQYKLKWQLQELARGNYFRWMQLLGVDLAVKRLLGWIRWKLHPEVQKSPDLFAEVS